MKGLPNIKTACPGKWWSHQPLSYLTHIQIWHFGSWFTDGLGSATLMDSIVRVLSMFLTMWGEGENLANLFPGSPWVSGMGWMIKCLEQSQDSIILAMLFMLLISLETELTQKGTISLQEEQKKKKAGLVCTTSLSHSLFFMFCGSETASQAQMYHLLSFLSYSFFPPSPLQYLR